ncbi:MAG TPA: N-acetylmuramoyl-L-alanine amidase [Thermomicrobiaceae bacterium]|nr:N-acetylmuramoyl-L-alanine amidase [Thermomicrobiaceae bacterium]
MLLCLITVLALALPAAPTAAAAAGPLNAAFQQAAARFDVPRDLLVAIAYAETHFDAHGGQPSVDNGYGLMHLVDNPSVHTLAQAATLLGSPAEQLKSDPAANIAGGAALLRSLADQLHLDGQERGDLAAWYPVLERYSNATDPAVARLYAGEVVQLLNSGVSAQSPRGETIELAPRLVEPQAAQFQATTPSTTGSDLDYPATLWLPASSQNYEAANRPVDGPIDLIIIHVTEGSYTSTLNWFQDPKARVSTQYVIRSSDGQITQMVHDKDIAWHAGNADYNARAIGIEHEGYTADGSWFTDAMYRASAALVRQLCLTYHIPMDRQHIIGHAEVPDPDHPGQYGGASHHDDPGLNWDWDYYMKLVNSTPAVPVAEAPTATYFSETGHNLGPLFGAYWNANGGLPVFGYPHTDSFPEQNPDDGQVYTVQYFERQRFEYHPENQGTPYVVELGRLGLSDARSRGLLDTSPFQPRPAPAAAQPGCDYYSETGHFLCNTFRAYWQSHGLDFGDPGFSARESLALFGYPISEEYVDPQTGYVTQYFERARFEYHPEFKGTPYDVELGLLGNQVLSERGWLAAPSP